MNPLRFHVSRAELWQSLTWLLLRRAMGLEQGSSESLWHPGSSSEKGNLECCPEPFPSERQVSVWVQRSHTCSKCKAELARSEVAMNPRQWNDKDF